MLHALDQILLADWKEHALCDLYAVNKKKKKKKSDGVHGTLLQCTTRLKFVCIGGLHIYKMIER